MTTVHAHHRPAAGVSDAVVGDELALLRSDTGDVLVLNTSASEIWGMCDGARTTDDIVLELRRRHPGSDQIDTDVFNAIELFSARGFLADGAGTASLDGPREAHGPTGPTCR